MEETKLVHLASIYNVMEANLLKSKLESEGIKCFVFDENTMKYSSMVGSVRVMVSEKDAHEALIILESTKPGYTGIILCPNCSSNDISVKQNLGAIVLHILFALVAMVAGNNSNKSKKTCNDCGHTWK